jgi:hypothetical protein
MGRVEWRARVGSTLVTGLTRSRLLLFLAKSTTWTLSLAKIIFPYTVCQLCQLCLLMSTEWEDEFDIRLWLVELNLTEPGLKKIANNDVTDLKCLRSLTVTDVNDLKLSVGDKRRLVDGLSALHLKSKGDSADSSVSQDLPGNGTPQPLASTSGSSDAISVKGQVGVTVAEKTSFSVSDVANFLAGNQIPDNVKNSLGSLNNQPNQLPEGVSTSVIPVQSPQFPLPGNFACGYQNTGYAGIQNQQNGGFQNGGQLNGDFQNGGLHNGGLQNGGLQNG